MGEFSSMISRPLPSSLESGESIIISDYNSYAADNFTEKSSPDVIKDIDLTTVEEEPWGTQLTNEYNTEIEYVEYKQLGDLKLDNLPVSLAPEEQTQSFYEYFGSDEIIGEDLDAMRGEMELWEDGEAPDIPVYVGTSWPEETLGRQKPWRALEKHGVFGGVDPVYFGGNDPISDLDENILPTYFSGDVQMALSHAEFFNRGLIELSLQKLVDKRSIFIDPEGMHLPEELGKSFVVMGGIPKDCIDRVHHFN